MCRSGALIHPAARPEGGEEGGGPKPPLLRSIFRQTHENRRTACARMSVETFEDGRVRARSPAGAASRWGPDGSWSPRIKLNEVGLEAHSRGLGVHL